MTNPTPVMSWEQEVQNSSEQLRYLTIAAYIYAGLNACGVLFGAAFLALAASAVVTGGFDPSNTPEMPQFLVGGGMFVIVGILVLLCVIQFLFARWLQTRTHHTGTLVLAAFTCLSVPFGTALGVWALIVLLRPSTKVLYPQSATYAGARSF